MSPALPPYDRDALGSPAGSSWLRDGAAAWGRSPAFLAGLWAVPAAILLGGVASAALGKPAFKSYAGEDRFVETMQVLCYAAALLFDIVIVRQLWQSGRQRIALLYAVVLAGLLFMLGEEVSWGQRLFGWQTPASLREVNLQQETTVHNIRGVAKGVKWMQWMAGAYGTILPLWVWQAGRSRRLQEWISFVVPHFTLVPFFAPMFLWRCYRNLIPPPARHHFFLSRSNEVFEFTVAAGVLFFMAYQWQRLRSESDQPKNM